MASSMADTYSFDIPSCIRGHHIYHEVWTPTVGERRECIREMTNIVDRYAVGVYKSEQLIGHLPKKISIICLRHGGDLSCEVTRRRSY